MAIVGIKGRAEVSHTALTEQIEQQQIKDLPSQARSHEQQGSGGHGHDRNGADSPQAFYERSVRRSDVREILQRLADA